MFPNTIFVLNRNYLGEAEGSILEATSVPNIYRIQGTAKFVGSAYAREVEVEVVQVVVESTAVQAEQVQEASNASNFFDMMTRWSLSINTVLSSSEVVSIEYLQQHVRGLSINVGDSYRYYTRSTNRWDLATFEMTGTDIGRVVSGFAIKSPSRKTAKRKLLKALNDVYGLLLSADEIKESANN